MKRGKTDASDAEAICEAVTRPTMRFVAVKSEEGLVVAAERAQAAKGRGSGSGQQNRTHRLGDLTAERSLRGPSRITG